MSLTLTNLSGFGGGGLNPPPEVTYTAEGGYGTNLTTYTFEGVSIGTASDDRVVYAAFCVQTAAGNFANAVPSSATIGGSAANLIGYVVTSDRCGVAVYALNVTSGTTANFACTFTGAGARGGLGVFIATGTGGADTSANCTVTSGTATGSNTTVSASASVGPNKAGFAVATIYNSGTSTNYDQSWSGTGVTEAFETLMEDSTGSFRAEAGGATLAADSGSITITDTPGTTFEDGALIAVVIAA